MAREHVAHLAFNRGIMSRLAGARLDLQRTALSAEIMTNWMPRALGSMSLRPGWQYLGSTYNDGAVVMIPFIYTSTDTALIEVGASALRVWIDDEVVQRESVSTAITNGTFGSDVTGWTDSDESGGTSQWLTGGYLALQGNGTAAAIRDQTVSVSAGDVGTEHALRVVIARGPVTLRVGSTSGGDEYITETSLGTGTHSLAFTPTGTFYIRLQSRLKWSVLVDSVAIEAAGDLTLPSPWGADDLPLLRWDASADVTYVACYGKQQRKIERRGTRSWSIVLYEPMDGPFRIQNTGPITITASALTGDVTLTASKSLFRSSHVGSLIRAESTGQTVTASITAQDTFTDPIRVTGVGGQRTIAIVLSGTFSATVTLQYSIGEPGSWVDTTTAYTLPTSTSFTDELDNQVIYYRIGVKSGAYTSGTVSATLTYASGGIVGIARITAYSSPTSVSAVVIDDFGALTATSDWWEGAWSDYRGYPSAVALFDGRLWWAGKAKMWGSVADGYESFDDFEEGDAAPIARSFGSGPVDQINWLIGTNELFAGNAAAEVHARSSSQAELLTPTNFNLRNVSTRGSAAVGGERLDERGLFVHRGGTRLFDISFDTEALKYTTSDLSMLVPDLSSSGIVKLGVQRTPDTRIHCVRADGTVAVLVIEDTENVSAWCEVETDGEVEGVVVLPGDDEDRVYYVVNRDGGRYLEKWALESETVGGTLNKQADSFIVQTGAATTAVTGLDHLEGQSVIAWGDGVDLGTYTVSSGAITLTTAAASVVVGLGYTARWKPMRKALANSLGTPLNQRKRVAMLGLLLKDTHAQGLEFGPDFDTMDNLPLYEKEALVGEDTIHSEYEGDMIEFPGDWDTDARFCLRATAPRPCTVLAVVASVVMNERAAG